MNEAKTLSQKEQKQIMGGVFTWCNGLGETGQRCVNHSDCTGPGNPVCHNGCCNILV